MKWLAVDYGDSRTGLAGCDAGETITSPITPQIEEKSMNKVAAAVTAVAQARGAEALVCGLPKNMDGTEGSRANKSRRFAQRLANTANLSVVLWDERRTTVSAAAILADNDTFGAKRKERLDSVSAAVILESFLNWRAQHIADGTAHDHGHAERPELAAQSLGDQRGDECSQNVTQHIAAGLAKDGRGAALETSQHRHTDGGQRHKHQLADGAPEGPQHGACHVHGKQCQIDGHAPGHGDSNLAAHGGQGGKQGAQDHPTHPQVFSSFHNCSSFLLLILYKDLYRYFPK